MKRTAGHVLIGIAAAALGAGGTAVAADLITGADVKNRSLQVKDLSKKARKALKGRRGLAGPQGPEGPAGPPGPIGYSTERSIRGARLLVGSGDLTGDAQFIAIGAEGSGTSEGEFQVPVPAAATQGLRASGLRVQLVAPAGVERRFVVRLHGTDTSLGCAIAPSESRCTSLAEVPLGSTSLLSIQHTASGAGPARVSLAIEIDEPG